MCKRAAEWRSGRERERRTSVRNKKCYDRNKGVVSEHGSGQSGEWRLIRDWNDEGNRRDPRRWRDGGYKWISRGELSLVNFVLHYHLDVVLLLFQNLWCLL